MDKKEAYKIVFNDVMEKDIRLFKGIYDAENGNKEFMYGIKAVMEYLAYEVDEDTYLHFSDIFRKYDKFSK